MNIENKAVLITGANRGIGRALVEEALRRGARRVYAATRQPFAHSDQRVASLIAERNAVDAEIDQPDNGWLVCTDTKIDLYLMGTDTHSIYQDFNSYLGANGWAAVAPGSDPHFELYEKNSPRGQWSASVFEQLFWVEVSISDYGGPVKAP